jgi:hypothetical protein
MMVTVPIMHSMMHLIWQRCYALRGVRSLELGEDTHEHDKS